MQMPTRRQCFNLLLLASVFMVAVTMYRSGSTLSGHGWRMEPRTYLARNNQNQDTQRLDDRIDGKRDADCVIKKLPNEVYLKNASYYFKLRPSVVNHFLPNITINAASVCPRRKPLFLLIVVPSMTGHVKERTTIRQTWASPLYGGQWPGQTPGHSAKLVFFLGKKNSSFALSVNLTKENERYGDIVQADFKESYRNLSLKMGAVLHWCTRFCPTARHVLKVDEDTFVHLQRLMNMLQLVSAHHRYYVLGHGAGNAQRGKKRSSGGKWEVASKIYPFKAFPVYLYGHSYVISGDAISDLLYAYQHMPFVPVEDAFITGILRKTLGMKILRCWQFAVGGEPSRWKKAFVYGKCISQTAFKANRSKMYSVWRWIQSASMNETVK